MEFVAVAVLGLVVAIFRIYIVGYLGAIDQALKGI